MMLHEFRLPDLGEGLTESEVVAWRIAVGDHIELNQVIADIETAKAIVELPSPFAGTVVALHAEAGQMMDVGAPLLSFDVADETPTTAAPEARQPNLVGYGTRVESATARPRTRTSAPAAAPPRAAPEVLTTPSTPPAGESERPRSTPPVRKLARDRGVDLAGIHGTGEFGRITRDDVLGGSTTEPASATTVASAAESASATTVRLPIKGIRRSMAAAMVTSAFTAPHVTEFLTIDVTAATELLARLTSDHEFDSHRMTFLTICARAVCIALARHPVLNSSWDDDAQEIVQFGTVNLGIAAATPRGLVVPNIKDAGRMPFPILADALSALTTAARAGTTPSTDLRDGTFTISNIGVFGIDAGTPILNPGEAGILAIGAVRTLPWEHLGEIALRRVLTLSLSFDHRVVDGEQGSRFLKDVGTVLHDPARALAMV